MFYVNINTKHFVAGPQVSNSSGECCYCCEGSDVPLFLRTKVANPSLIKKPTLTHYETAIIQFSLRDSQGFPYDLTGKELVLAIDNTFQHSDSLIALSSQFLVLDAQQGIVQFTVKCSSRKFQKMVNNKIPASQVYMQITSYSQQDIQGTVILQDRGITLQPKLYTTQGIPEDNDPNYYNKQQTRSVIAAYIKIAEAQSNSEVQQALLDFIHSEFYDKGEVDSFIGALSNSFNQKLGYYYTSSQVDGLLGSLSDSFNSKLQELDSYTRAQLSSRYTKDQADLISSNLDASIKAASSTLNSAIISVNGNFSNYYTSEQVNSIAGSQSAAFDSKLQGYYNKGQVDGFVSSLNTSVSTASSTLNSAITAVDSILQGLHIQKAQTPQQGYTATYHLKDSQGNTKGDPINVLQDSFLKSAAFIIAAAQDHTADPSVVVGDPYLKFQFYVQKDGSQTTSIQYVPLKDLVDVYTAGDGLQGTSQFSIKLDSNTQTSKYLQVNSSGLAVKGIDSALGSVSNTFSSYYTKPEVDGISSTLNNAVQNTDGKFASYYTSTQVNNISSTLNAAIETASSTVNESFTSYYTSSQVDQLLTQLSNSVDLSDYYKNSQVDAISSTLNTSIGTVNGSFVSYYTSTQVNNISSNLNSAVSDVNDRFGSYYTSTQVSGLIKQLSDSIAELKGAFASYYTSAQVNNISSTLNASVGTVDGKFVSYYNSTEVNGISSTLNASVEAVSSAFSGYYNKTQVDAVSSALNTSIGAVDGKFASYYNSTQVNGISSTLNASFGNYYNSTQVDTVSSTLNTAVNTASSNLNTSIANVSSTLVSYYYTGAQVEGFIDDLSNSLQTVKNSLGSYCTNASASAISSTLNTAIGAVNTSLGSYYTSTQVNNISSTLSSAIGTVDNKFTSYYTSSQVDGIADALSNSIASIKSSLNSYYNKGEVDSFIDSISNSIEALDNKITQQKNYNNLTNKPSIEGVTLQGNVSLSDFGLPQFIGTYMQFSAVDANNQYTINGTNTVPVAVLTGANHIYLIQKGSLIRDAVNDTLIFDATPYMAYDDAQTFTGTWRLYFAAGNSPKNGDLILPKTSTSIVPQHGLIIRHTLQTNDTILISTSQLTSDRQVTFELHLIQPSTAVSFTLPNTLIWSEGDKFSSANPAPAMSQANMLYCVVIRWDGSDLIANLAYSKEVSA